MHKTFLAIPVVLALSGCATTPTGQVDIVKTIQNATVQACFFLPTVETVAAILSAGNPILVTAGSIAEAICNAVKPLAAGRRGQYVPTVAGVVVHGKFVR